MSVYYGYGLTGKGLDVLKVGNESRIVGTLQYYEAGGTWQVSGLSYRLMKPKDPGNIQLLSSGHAPAYTLTSPELFAKGQVELAGEEGTQVFDYAALAVGTSVEMKNLQVQQVYTTLDEDSSSYGAMTLTCQADGQTIRLDMAAGTVTIAETGEVLPAQALGDKAMEILQAGGIKPMMRARFAPEA